MNRIHKIIGLVMLLAILMPKISMAGNDDRRGTAGAGELLINPWTRSAGWSSVNTANGSGLDALFTNVAGLGHTTGTDVAFDYSHYLNNSDINIVTFGLAQSLGNYGVLGLTVNSMSFGSIQRTTVNSPEAANNGTYKPSLMNLGVSYSKAFSNSIYAGATIKIVSEGIDNVTATGIAIDAGIQYVTGRDYEIKFGISLKNWGPSMSYSGDGLSVNALIEHSNHYQTIENRSLSFELPSSLNIGASYDFLFAEKTHRLTVAGNYESMAFTNDRYTAGLEYAFKNIFMLRTGYTFDSGVWDDIYESTTKVNFSKGFSAGASVIAPLQKAKGNKKGIDLSFDYAYRTTVILGGIHSIGVTLSM
ncbi:MAG: PorV/PorQ family protein [Bacteroidales bacterium]|nr:PorV/PorQ family protein [Bacteroidales bacterium]